MFCVVSAFQHTYRVTWYPTFCAWAGSRVKSPSSVLGIVSCSFLSTLSCKGAILLLLFALDYTLAFICIYLHHVPAMYQVPRRYDL